MQAWEWGDLKARTGWEPLRLGLMHDGRITGGMQILVRRAPGGRSLLYAARGPLLPDNQPEALGGVLAEVRDVARQHKGLALKIDPAIIAPNDAWRQALRARGFRPTSTPTSFGGVQPHYVMKVNIAPTPEDLLASFHPKWRYNIRLAQKKGVVIRPGTRHDLPAFYEVLQETCRRDGFGVRSLSYYYDLWDLVLAPGLGGLFVGFLDEEMICGAITLAMGRQAWYVYGASSNRHRNVMPNHLLQWEMMQWARGRGCSVYDMRGVAREVPGEDEAEGLHGLNRFKRGFGAEYMEYLGEFDLVLSPLWYAAYTAAQKLRAVRRRQATGQAATAD